MPVDKFNLMFEKMETTDRKEEDLDEAANLDKKKKKKTGPTYEGTIDQISEDFTSDTIKFIDELTKDKDLDDKTKDMLKGMQEFLKKNKFLSPGQREALAAISQKAKEKI